MGRKMIDLTGQVFADGNIEVIKNIPNKRKSKWECKCICGNIFIADGYNLRTGYTKSCGCKTVNKFIDLTGIVFERLKVIKRADNQIQSNGVSIVMWECECECGNKIITSSRSLKSGDTKSCGCLAREKARERCKNLRKRYNEYNLTGSYGIGYTSKGEEFWFDLEDYDKIKDYCWTINNNGYAIAHISDTTKKVLLHRLIMNPPDKMYIDHINHNRIDNRKQNLRIVTIRQNNLNKKKSVYNTSGVTGVYYKKNNNKWIANISIDGKNKHLGCYETIEDAIKARKEAEEKYFGEYSYDNSMKGDENNEQESQI